MLNLESTLLRLRVGLELSKRGFGEVMRGQDHPLDLVPVPGLHEGLDMGSVPRRPQGAKIARVTIRPAMIKRPARVKLR